MSTSEKNCTALAHPLSRRQFLSLAAVVGGLTFLGQVTVGPRVVNAYADEAGNYHFSVYVLSPEEVPVMAFDMSDAQNPKPLAGFSVQATAWRKDDPKNEELRAVTVKTKKPTDEYGFTPLNIRDLTDEYQQELLSYSCFANVVATKAGYQMFEASQMFLASGIHANDQGIYPNTLVIPALRDTGAPYLSLLAFDGLDVQHSKQEGYIVKGNDYAHALDITIRNAGSKPWNVVLFADGKEVARATTKQGKGNTATGQIKGAWLDGAHGVNEGTKLTLGWVQDGATEGFKTALRISFKKGIMLFEKGYANGLSIAEGDALAKTSEYAADKHSTDFPSKESGDKNWLGKNGKAVLGLLPLPVEICCNPDGSVVVTATLAGMFFMKRRDGENKLADPAQRWKPVTPQAVVSSNFSEWKRFAEHCGDLYDSSKGNWGTFGSSLAHAKPISTFDICVDVLLQGVGKTVPKKGAPEGSGDTTTTLDIAIGTMGKIAIEWTLPFSVGPIPCYVGIDFTASILVKLIFGMQFDVIDSAIQKPTWTATSVKGLPASAYNLTFEAGLNAGVGAKNLISLGVRGYGTMILDFTTQKKGDAYATLSGLMGAGVQAVAQFLCFRKVFDITKMATWHFVDKKWSNELPESVLRENPFGSSYPALDLSNEDFPVIEFDKSDMLAESDLLSNCYLSTYVRYLYDEDLEDWYWEEGCIVEGEWTPGSAESSHDHPGEPGDISIIFPYDANEESYNPLRGIKPSRQYLLRWGSFADDRSSTESMYHRWNSNQSAWDDTWFRIETVEVRADLDTEGEAASEGNPKEIQPFVYADESDPEAPTCFYMAPKDEEHDQLAAADVPKVVRTRLVWSNQVSDVTFWFDQLLHVYGISDRVNTWDCDFDTTHLNDTAFVALASFRRNPKEEKTWDEIFKTQFITLALFSPSGGRMPCSTFLHDESLTRWHPRTVVVQPQPNMRAKDKGYTCSVYFYERPKDGGKVTLGRGDYVESTDGKISTSISAVAVPECISDKMDSGTFSVNCCLCDPSVGLEDHRSAHQLQQRFIGWVRPKSSASDNGLAVFWHEGHPENAVAIEGVSAITPRPNRISDTLLSYIFCKDRSDTDEKDIYMISLDLESESIIGPTKVSSTTTVAFFTDLPTHLYAVRLMDGIAPAPEYPEDSDVVALSGSYGPFTSQQAAGMYGEAGKGGTVAQYQILRAEWLDGYQRYSHFYTLGMLDNPIDGLTHVPFGRQVSTAGEDFIAKTITSSQDCTADFRFITIPRVIGVQLEGVSAVTHFCVPGDPCFIDLMVSNVGNVPLKSFQFTVAASGKKSRGAAIEVTTTAEKLAPKKLESPDDYVQEVGEDGVPTGKWVKKEICEILPGTLMPGATRTYRVSFIMPDGVVGDTEFEVSAFANGNDAGYGSDNVNDGEDQDMIPCEYELSEEELAAAYILTDPRTKDIMLCSNSVEGGVDLSDYSAGTTKAWKVGGGGGNHGKKKKKKKNNNNNNNNNHHGGKNLPETGDNTISLLGATGTAAVAAAAAGVAWYEKRRAENEAADSAETH